MPNLVSLSGLRTQVLQRTNREGDDPTTGFVTTSELNGYINSSWQELYDLIVSRYQDQYANSVQFNITSVTDTYSFTTIGASDFYKGLGVDILISGQLWQPLKRFNMAERGQGSQLGALLTGYPAAIHLRYQLRGNAVVFRQPVPSATIRLWYIPVAPQMVTDGDTIDDVNGYAEFVVVDASIKVLAKENLDISAFMAQKQQLRERIISASSPRDTGGAITVSDSSIGQWGDW